MTHYDNMNNRQIKREDFGIGSLTTIPGRKEMTSKPKQATFYLFLQNKDIESYFVVYFHHNVQFKGILRYPSPWSPPLD
jgi:hypothetical protein